MASTYENDLRLEEMATGENSGSWGTKTNTNLELIADAFGYGTEAITTNADTHTTTIADGTSDAGRAIYLKYTGALDSACTITIGPNTVSKMWFIENATSGSQNIIISQGSGANITIGAGKTKIVYSDGAGAGAAFVEATDGISINSLFLEGNATFGDNDKAIFGAGSDLQIYHDGSNSYVQDVGTGNLFIASDANVNITNQATSELKATFISNGAVNLYYDNTKTFETTSSGVEVTGKLETSANNNAGAKANYIRITDTDTTATADNQAGGIEFFTNDVTPGIAASIEVLYAGTGGGGELTFNTNATSSGTLTEALRIDQNGNVGIGTTSPNAYSGYTALTLNHAVNGGIIDIERGGNLIGEIFSFDSNTFALSAVGSRAINFTTNSSERMRIDSTGNVGIGTTSPSTFNGTGSKLAVASGAGNVAALFSDATYYTLGIKHTGVGSEAVGMFGGTSGSALALMTNNTERLRIDSSSGNVGIGTSSPSTPLHVDCGAPSGSDKTIATFQSQATRQIGFVWDDSASTMGIATLTNNSMAFHTNGNSNEHMRLTSGGDLGLGTTTPHSTAWGTVGQGRQMEIAGGLGTSGYGVLHLSGSGSNNVIKTYSQGVGDNNFYMAYDADANTHRLTLGSNGNLYLGKTGSDNTAGIQLAQDGQAYLVRDGGTVLLLNRLSSDGTVVQFYNDSSGVGSISISGSSTAYNTSSDYRLKTDVRPMTGASARVQALNPVNFEWVSDGTRVDGFLAHEAATVVPEAIYGSKDAMKDEEYETSAAIGEIYTQAVASYVDEDGNEVAATDEVIHSTDVVEPETLAEGQLWRQTTEAVMGTRSVPDYQGIDQSKLVPLLTAALREALTKIDSLETRLTALEGA